MGGWPEDLEFLDGLLSRHPNLHLDNSATKWMVRELSKRPLAYRAFCARNPGRVLFGSDNVADPGVSSFELLASRYWALRTLHETDYEGPCPIVDPDLSLVDPALPAQSTATLRGAAFDPATRSTSSRASACASGDASSARVAEATYRSRGAEESRPRDLRRPLVELEGLLDQVELREDQRAGAEGVGLDDVGTDREEGLVDALDDIRTSLDEDLGAVLLAQVVPVEIAVAAMDHGAHGPVEHEHPPTQLPSKA